MSCKRAAQRTRGGAPARHSRLDGMVGSGDAGIAGPACGAPGSARARQIGKPAGGYRVAEQARRVGAVLDLVVRFSAAIVGHSTGGMVAASLAEQRRDLVTVIALIDTGPRADAYIGDSLISRLLPVPVVGQLLGGCAPTTPSVALGTALTGKVAIPDQIIADVRDMTYTQLHRNVPGVAGLPEGTARARSARQTQPTRPGDRLPGPALQRPSSAEDYRRVRRLGSRSSMLATHPCSRSGTPPQHSYAASPSTASR